MKGKIPQKQEQEIENFEKINLLDIEGNFFLKFSLKRIHHSKDWIASFQERFLNEAKIS